MYGLSKKEKMKFVLEKIKEFEISNYELGKKTGLSIAGINKLTSGEVKNPHENTLDTIIEFLINKQKSGELYEHAHLVSEPKEDIYNENNLEDLRDCLAENNKLTREIIKLQNLLRKNNIDFEDFFEDNK
jgi:predicted transcriptional regulator